MVDNPFRLPGQYDDGFSWRNNFFRDYLPEIGRYLQVDPFGLSGGTFYYSYVNSRVLSHIDPLGLECIEYDTGGYREWDEEVQFERSRRPLRDYIHIEFRPSVSVGVEPDWKNRRVVPSISPEVHLWRIYETLVIYDVWHIRRWQENVKIHCEWEYEKDCGVKERLFFAFDRVRAGELFRNPMQPISDIESRKVYIGKPWLP